ncbi:hypothetical protein HDU98_005480, partial [Podochytrium sp. JEL0797]
MAYYFGSQIHFASPPATATPTSAAAVPPISGAVYPFISQNTNFGFDVTNAMKWSNTNTAGTSSIVSLQLVLGTGSANQVQELYTLTTVAYPSVTCFEWTPTLNLTNPQYTIVFHGFDAQDNLVSTDYCTWFGLVGEGGVGYPGATSCGGGVVVTSAVNPTAT